MHLEHESSESIKKDVLNAIGKRLDLNKFKIFFFGSRVGGRENERSDIDIGIEGKEEIPIETMGDIQEAVDSIPTLYKIEIVDFKRVSSEFYKVATQNIEIINQISND